jgi:hypothetical protein
MDLAKEQFDRMKLINRTIYNQKRAENEKLRAANNGALPQKPAKGMSGRQLRRHFGVTATSRRGRRRRDNMRVAMAHISENVAKINKERQMMKLADNA